MLGILEIARYHDNLSLLEILLQIDATSRRIHLHKDLKPCLICEFKRPEQEPFASMQCFVRMVRQRVG